MPCARIQFALVTSSCPDWTSLNRTGSAASRSRRLFMFVRGTDQRSAACASVRPDALPSLRASVARCPAVRSRWLRPAVMRSAASASVPSNTTTDTKSSSLSSLRSSRPASLAASDRCHPIEDGEPLLALVVHVAADHDAPEVLAPPVGVDVRTDAGDAGRTPRSPHRRAWRASPLCAAARVNEPRRAAWRGHSRRSSGSAGIPSSLVQDQDSVVLATGMIASYSRLGRCTAHKPRKRGSERSEHGGPCASSEPDRASTAKRATEARVAALRRRAGVWSGGVGAGGADVDTRPRLS